ncbi:MAG: DUF4147 domain-containing protein [Polyangiaceae bacterium]
MLSTCRSLILGAFEIALHEVAFDVRLPPVLHELVPDGPVRLFAVGKAAGTMASVAAEELGARMRGALVVRPGDGAPFEHPRSETVVASHPLPDARSVVAAERALAWFGGAASDETIVALVSGGTSALLARPRGMTLDEKRARTAELLASGASIREVNRERKRMSDVKGGRLLRASRVRVVTLVASDVLGGELHDVGSGPTIPDDAVDVGLPTPAWDARSVVAPEDFVAAFAAALEDRGFATTVREPSLASVEALAVEYAASSRLLAPGHALVRAAEPSLVVPTNVATDACGGRSSHLAARVAKDLAPGVVFAALATDGHDGSADAGAIVDASLDRSLTDPSLEAFDTGTSHRRAKTAVSRFPSTTNLADLHVLLRPALFLLASVVTAPFVVACQRTESVPVPLTTPPSPQGFRDSGSVAPAPADANVSAGARSFRDAAPYTLGVLARSKRAPHAFGRAGDTWLKGSDGTSLLFSTLPAVHGMRPLVGGLLDFGVGDDDDANDAPDPLLWYRPGYVDAGGTFRAALAESMGSVSCPGGRLGFRAVGRAESSPFDTTFCPEEGGVYTVRTSADGLPRGAILADDLNAGTAQVLLPREGATWEGEPVPGAVALAENGTAFVVETKGAVVRRKLVHIDAETFPAPISIRYGGHSVERRIAVVRGDALDALAKFVSPMVRVVASIEGGRAGMLRVLSARGEELYRGTVPIQGRTFPFAGPFGSEVELRDGEGLRVARATWPEVMSDPSRLRNRPRPPSGTVRIHVSDGRGADLAAHLLVRGRGATADPVFFAFSGRSSRASDPWAAFGEAQSIYAPSGRTELVLAPGTYRLVVSHGIAHGLVARPIAVKAGVTTDLDLALPYALGDVDVVAGDFHLHAVPSPDAPVSLAQRVATLVCEGVDVAVATDHNHVTDYATEVATLPSTSHLASIVGDEITSSGDDLYGHFNAYPLPKTSGVHEESLPPYFALEPKAIFEGARAKGARFVQVNHARMPPRIGYFDLTHFDARTGKADATFADGFDVVEAWNGIWLSKPERAMESLRDVVGLARRGRRVALTGNSDSHRVHLEEVGFPRTYLRTPVEPRATLGDRALDALARGATAVSSGPLVLVDVEGASPDAPSVVAKPAKGPLRVRVRVLAPAWVPVDRVKVFVDDTAVASANVTRKVDGLRLDRTFDVPVSRDVVLFATAESASPLPEILPDPTARSFGFSGPVYVDADGDGRVEPLPASAPAHEGSLR